MTVGELINLLKKVHDKNIPVYIHDADTGCFLPVHMDLDDDNRHYDLPDDGVFIHGKYAERLKSF